MVSEINYLGTERKRSFAKSLCNEDFSKAVNEGKSTSKTIQKSHLNSSKNLLMDKSLSNKRLNSAKSR